MKTYVVLMCVTTFFSLTTIPLDAGNVPPADADILMDEASADLNGTVSMHDDNAIPIPRQEEEDARPYEYIPRVFHSLRKIIKGVLNGSFHEILHGSFSFAPREVSNEIIGVYNQVVGLPDPLDPTEKPYNATLEELLEEEFEAEEEEAKI
ncbi:unnamed protein product [Orchesella dallaii]|uniref:Uncharacterized protein n=1 Tax=Orchesella dallaii TaxID=48710 RepID=A0ABP1RDH9_9HEXA